MLRRAVLLLSLAAAPALGQEAAVPTTRSNVDFARTAWREVHDYLVRSAEMAPDSLYAFRPTPEVRSFAEMLDHVAASEHGYCRMALGERPAGGGDATGAKTRAEVLAALQAAQEVCERAYAQREDEVVLAGYGGGRTSRLQILLGNTMHDYEHYGNVVTYLRMHRLVPPSSQPSSP